MTKRKKIEMDENGKVVKWYGFWVTEDIYKEDYYIDFFKSGGLLEVALCLKDEIVAVINYAELYLENAKEGKVIHTENEIMNYIYTECRKHVKCRKIFVNEIDTELIKVAGGEDIFMSDEERKLDDYFFEREMHTTY